jgi:hypothetical protein
MSSTTTIGLLLHRAGQLAQVEHEAAIAGQHHSAPAQVMHPVGHRRTNAHGQALADATAQRMHAGARMIEQRRAIAPHGVGQGDVTHPPQGLAGRRLQPVLERHIRPNGGIDQGLRGQPRGTYIGGVLCVDLHLPLERIGQRIERELRIALHEHLAVVGAVLCQRVHVNPVAFGWAN